jgi:hypothetical protein
MELSIKDRLYIPALLPKEGNFKEFNLKKEALRKIELSEEEREKVGLRENAETRRIEWDMDKEKPLIVEFTGQEMAYLKQACERIADERLPDEMWDSVEKIYNAMQG